jgi:hypothetical protein
MSKKYIYGGKESEVSDASGVSGVLIKNYGGGFSFRVYKSDHDFIDYQIYHDDLPVTISPDALASFYSNDEGQVLDHSPNVFGLRKVGE